MKVISFIKKVIGFGSGIEWKSKIIDLLIVIIGITLAFRLNSWSESKKQDDLLQNYLTSFALENQSNIKSLVSVIDYAQLQSGKVDTLQKIMRKGSYLDSRLQRLSPSLLNMVTYGPSVITMENIKESGDFELIKDYKLRKKIITAYESISEIKDQEKVLNDYVKNITRPYFFEKIRYRDFYPVDDEGLIKDHRFENMIIGYGLLIKRQMSTYRRILNTLQDLQKELENDTEN